MKFKLIIFVVIMLSLTAYTIYGGVLDKEEIAITNSINETFNTIKNALSHRDIDFIVRDNIKYEINNIDINKESATADTTLTGVDLAQSFYEMDMFHAFYREFSLSSSLLFTEQIMDTYSVYTYILNKNINDTQTNNLKIHLNKSNDVWNVSNINDIYRALEKTSISLTAITNKAYENLEKARETMNDKYLQESPVDKTFEEYWSDYLFDFITNMGYVTQYPFEEQLF